MTRTVRIASFFIVFVVLLSGILLTVFQKTNRNPLVLFRAARPEEPKQLVIPKLHINTLVESVAKDGEGRMDVPKKTEDVAWYNLGFRPGENGNAVIAGHYDTPLGTAAVFYHLKDLKKGDKLMITDKNNKQYTFIVTSNVSYDDASIPLQQIFGPDSQPVVNLITCDGYYDHATRNYTKRDVVTAEEQGSSLRSLFSYNL